MLLEAEPAKVRPGGGDRTEARRREALDLAGLHVGSLRIGGESFDDAVQLAGLAQLRHLAQAEQRPVGVLPLHADGLDERQVLVRGFATALDRPLHEHTDILQRCELSVQAHFAPTPSPKVTTLSTARPGHRLAPRLCRESRAKLRPVLSLRERFPCRCWRALPRRLVQVREKQQRSEGGLRI